LFLISAEIPALGLEEGVGDGCCPLRVQVKVRIVQKTVETKNALDLANI
jgi:hypothetical protein